jgi:hypothetical protein
VNVSEAVSPQASLKPIGLRDLGGSAHNSKRVSQAGHGSREWQLKATIH